MKDDGKYKPSSFVLFFKKINNKETWKNKKILSILREIFVVKIPWLIYNIIDEK